MIVEKHSRYQVFYPEPLLVVRPGSFKGTPQELATVIKQQIDTYPESFDMSSFVEEGTGHAAYSDSCNEEDLANVQKLDKTACGTTLCIAGYAQLFVDGFIDTNVNPRAQDLLGIRSDWLFFAHNDTARRALDALATGTFDEDTFDEDGELSTAYTDLRD